MTKTKIRCFDGYAYAPLSGAQAKQAERGGCILRFVYAPTGGAQANQAERGGCILHLLGFEIFILKNIPPSN